MDIADKEFDGLRNSIMTDEVLTTPDEVSDLKSKNAAQSDPHPVSFVCPIDTKLNI